MGKEQTQPYFDRGLNRFVGLDIPGLKKAFKDIDVDRELLKMGIWLTSVRGIRHTGSLGFVMKWLEKATPSPKIAMPDDDTANECSSVLRPILNTYLQDLWRGNEQLLTMNQRTA